MSHKPCLTQCTQGLVLIRPAHEWFAVACSHLCLLAASASDKLPIQTFVLPDDSELKVDSDRFRVPELLFNPSPLTVRALQYPPTIMSHHATVSLTHSLMCVVQHLKYRTSRPLHDMVVGSVLACELDARNQLFCEFVCPAHTTMWLSTKPWNSSPYAATIVLTGGGSVFKGLSQRLQHEVSIVAAVSVVPPRRAQRHRHALPHCHHSCVCQTKSKVVAANVKERRLGVWIGGSILGSLGSFHDMWVGASEYADHGASIIDRKCP